MNINFLKQFTEGGLQIVIQCSNIPEEELFKICLEFWFFFTYDILQKSKKGMFSSQQMAPVQGMNFDIQNNLLQNSFMHGQIYPKILE